MGFIKLVQIDLNRPDEENALDFFAALALKAFSTLQM